MQECTLLTPATRGNGRSLRANPAIPIFRTNEFRRGGVREGIFRTPIHAQSFHTRHYGPIARFVSQDISIANGVIYCVCCS